MNSLKRVRAFQIELEFGLKCQFLRRKGKREYPEQNLSEAGREPTKKSTQIWFRRRDLKPGPHWWETSALISATPLLPCTLSLFKRSCDSHQPRHDFIFMKYPAQVSLQSISARFGDTKCLPFIFNSSVCLYFAARHQPKNSQDISNQFDGKDS